MSGRFKSIVGVAAAVAVAAPAAAPASAAAAAPEVEQLIAFRNGNGVQTEVVASRASAKVGGKRCAVGAGTPLAALLISRPPAPLTLRDYGACSRKPSDAGGLYVARIAQDRARGINGWVYKVGNKVATAGAGDPSGPFGRGRLEDGARVTWFYCRSNRRTGACQRTLRIVKLDPYAAEEVRVTVRSYDDRGRGRPAAGAVVHSGDVTATTDAHGQATLEFGAPGTATVVAAKDGSVRSFEEQVEVK